MRRTCQRLEGHVFITLMKHSRSSSPQILFAEDWIT